MGGSTSHETKYNYVDNTEKERQEEKERERIRLENERKKKELEEQQRIERARKEAEERLRREGETARQRRIQEEDDRRRREKEEARRQAEAKRQRELKIRDRREKLFDYKFGDKINLASFRGLKLNDVTQLRIGVFGPTGSGKSCFINTCERVVLEKDKGSAPPNTTGGEGTIILEDYLTCMFFRLVDTRGFFQFGTGETHEFLDILYGRIKQGDQIRRGEDGPGFTMETGSTPFSEQLHGIILVVKANDTRLQNGSLKDYLNPVRQVLRPIGISPITVVTHRDKLKTPQECEDALDLASAATGSARSHTFFVANYCTEITERNFDTEEFVFDILHFALLTAERYVKIAKQQQKNKTADAMAEAMGRTHLGGPPLNIPDASVDVFLNTLQSKYQWSQNSVTKALAKLQEDDVTTVEAMATCWEDVKGHFVFGMQKMLEKELRNLKMI